MNLDDFSLSILRSRVEKGSFRALVEALKVVAEAAIRSNGAGTVIPVWLAERVATATDQWLCDRPNAVTLDQAFGFANRSVTKEKQSHTQAVKIFIDTHVVQRELKCSRKEAFRIVGQALDLPDSYVSARFGEIRKVLDPKSQESVEGISKRDDEEIALMLPVEVPTYLKRHMVSPAKGTRRA